MTEKKLYLLSDIKTPPIAIEARREIGLLLRRLQLGEKLSMPASKPMPSITKGCHELRVRDRNHYWRLVYYVNSKEIVVLEVFSKKTNQTPKKVIDNCKRRLKEFLSI